jgi:hypothetical protein
MPAAHRSPKSQITGNKNGDSQIRLALKTLQTVATNPSLDNGKKLGNATIRKKLYVPTMKYNNKH